MNSKYTNKALVLLLIAALKVTPSYTQAKELPKPSPPQYVFSFAEQRNRERKIPYITITEKETGFMLRAVDIDNINHGNGMDLVRLVQGETDFLYWRNNISFQSPVKEVQLFDIADKIREYLAKSPEQQNPLELDSLRKSVDIIKKRFLSKKGEQRSVKYDIGRLFSVKFEPQNTLGDLIIKAYVEYSKLIREFKSQDENFSIGDAIKSLSWWNKFVLGFSSKVLFENYKKNLSDPKLGYNLESISIKGNYVEAGLIDIRKNSPRKDLPYLKVEINFDSMPDSLDVAEIEKFLNGNEPFFKYAKDGSYQYGGFRTDKRSKPSSP